MALKSAPLLSMHILLLRTHCLACVAMLYRLSTCLKCAASFEAITISSRSPGLLDHLLYLLVVLLAEVKCEQPLMVCNMAGIASSCVSAPPSVALGQDRASV